MKPLALIVTLALASPAAALEFPTEHLGGLTLDSPLAVTGGGIGNRTGDISGLNYGGAAIASTFCKLGASCTWSGQQLFGTDWLSAVIPFTVAGANLSSISTNGGGGLLGASQTSYYTIPGHMGTIGVGGFVLNNNATYANGAWAFYGEARRYAGSATTIGIENDIINEGSTVSVNPYSVLTTPGITIDYWASSGRSDVSSSATASLAYGIVNNGANFQRGIVVMSSAISGATGTSGVGEAISMAQGHQIAWYAPDGNPAAFIWSSIVSSEEGQALVFTDTGPQFRNSAGNPLFSIGASATAVDGLTLTPANTGGIPIIAASGTDTNIPLAIRAKGAAQPIYFQSNSTTVFAVAPIASGVNYLLAIGATTGNPPQLAVNGSDTNIGIALKPQGTGVVSVGGGGLQLPGFTVSTLPSCVAGLAGTIAYVTDATAPSYNAPLAGAGSVKTLALCNGSTWTAH